MSALEVPTLAPVTSRLPFRWFGVLLPIVLAGYLFFDKTFAYLHIPGTPIFVGEIVLVVGAVEAFRGRRLIAVEMRRSPALALVLAFLLVGSVRLLLFDLASHGVLAVRDSALWYYAAFTPLLVILLRVRPEWLDVVRARYSALLPAYLVWAPLAVVLQRIRPFGLTVPDSDVPLTSYRPGNVGVHIALALGYLWLVERGDTAHDRRRRIALTALGVLGVLVVGTQNRAGLIAATLGLAVAWIVTPLRTRLTMSAGAALLVLVAVPAMLNLSVNVGARTVSVQQVVENASSIMLGAQASGSLGDNVEWRQRLWGFAVDDLFDSGREVFGFGYGENIAARYSVDTQDDLRNPHNSHLSVLVRMGVVGLTVWILLWLVWMVPLVRALWRRGLRRGGTTLAVWAWAAVGVSSILINAFFDPTVEGPQVGIWLWTLTGIGVHMGLTAPLGDNPPPAARQGAGGAEGGVTAPAGTSLGGRRAMAQTNRGLFFRYRRHSLRGSLASR